MSICHAPGNSHPSSALPLLADNLDVAASIFLGREPRKFGFIRSAELRLRARELIDRAGLNAALGAIVGNLSIGTAVMRVLYNAISVLGIPHATRVRDHRHGCARRRRRRRNCQTRSVTQESDRAS